MLKLETDILKLEFDEKINEDNRKLITDILDKMYGCTGLPIESSTENHIKTELQEYSEHIKKEPDETIDLKQMRFPRCISDITCSSCNQSFIMLADNDDVIFKNMTDGKLYNLGNITMPKIPKIETARIKKLTDIYNDCLSICFQKQTVTLLSESHDRLTCPFCEKTITIADMVKKIDTDHTQDKCFICGGEKEMILNKDKSETFKCIKNNCLENLK